MPSHAKTMNSKSFVTDFTSISGQAKKLNYLQFIIYLKHKIILQHILNYIND